MKPIRQHFPTKILHYTVAIKVQVYKGMSEANIEEQARLVGIRYM